MSKLCLLYQRQIQIRCQFAFPWLREGEVVAGAPDPFDYLFGLTIPQEVDEWGEAEEQWGELQSPGVLLPAYL